MALGLALNDALLGQKPRAFIQDDTGLSLLLNVLKEDTESDSCDITDHAIESGSSVSDHVWLKPKEVSMTVVLTDDIVSTYDPVENAVTGLTPTEFVKSIDDRMDLLQIWLYMKLPLTIFGHKNDYEDMVISSVSRVHDADVGDNLALDIAFKQVVIATSQSVSISMAGQTASGSQVKSGTAANATKSKSIAASLMGIK